MAYDKSWLAKTISDFSLALKKYPIYEVASKALSYKVLVTMFKKCSLLHYAPTVDAIPKYRRAIFSFAGSTAHVSLAVLYTSTESK